MSHLVICATKGCSSQRKGIASAAAPESPRLVRLIAPPPVLTDTTRFLSSPLLCSPSLPSVIDPSQGGGIRRHRSDGRDRQTERGLGGQIRSPHLLLIPGKKKEREGHAKFHPCPSPLSDSLLRFARYSWTHRTLGWSTLLGLAVFSQLISFFSIITFFINF
jgi:hypothetical protein